MGKLVIYVRKVRRKLVAKNAGRPHIDGLTQKEIKNTIQNSVQKPDI